MVIGSRQSRNANVSDTYAPGRTNPIADRIGVKHGLAWVLLINAAIGIAFASYFFSRSFLGGTVAMFLRPEDDMVQYLTGSKFFIYDSWRFPLLISSYVERSYPQSMAFTDCIPLFAIITKLIYKITGQELNYLAWWYALVVVAQPVSFSLLLWFGGVRNKILLLTGGILSILVPTFLYRAMQAAMFGHFIILTAMALYFAAVNEGWSKPAWPRWVLVTWPAFLLFCATINLYLLVMAGIFFAAALAQTALRDFRTSRGLNAGLWALYGTCVAPAVAALMFVLGYFVPYSLEDPETLAKASTNLISPFVPQLSALFAGSSTIIDATGVQYEGYNYLGAGLLMLMLFAIVFANRRPLDLVRGHPFLVCALLFLFLFAVSSKAYAGQWAVWSFEVPDRLAAFRAPGRFVWPVTYFGIFLSFYAIDAWRPRWRLFVVVAACLLLQWQDTRLLTEKIWGWGHATEQPQLRGDPAGLRALIAQHRGLYIAPDYACLENKLIIETTKDLGFYAALERKPVNTIYFSRLPIDQDCSIEQSKLDAKLQQGYLAVVFYDKHNADTHLLGLKCGDHNDAKICLASEKIQITDDLARKLFETH